MISHQLEKKYGGLKSIVTYELQTEIFPNQNIKHRYNQFKWLHDRLNERYPNICLPALPEKSMIGNFEDDFIRERKYQLELWLKRLSSHPVIRESELFIHFLQSDISKWKIGKRKAENEELTGAQWMYTVKAPIGGDYTYIVYSFASSEGIAPYIR